MSRSRVRVSWKALGKNRSRFGFCFFVFLGYTIGKHFGKKVGDFTKSATASTMQLLETENVWNFYSKHLPILRSRADSNRCTRFCRPLPSHSATRPVFGAAKIQDLLYSSKRPDLLFSFSSFRQVGQTQLL